LLRCFGFFAHAVSAVSVGLCCFVQNSRGPFVALPSPCFLRPLVQVLHLSLLVVVSGDIEVSPVLVVFAALPSRATLPSTSLVSLPSEFLRCPCSPRVHLPLPHLRFVLAVGQRQGVMWEAWGPIVHREPWGSELEQPEAPSVRPSQGPSS
jgi:hypothetical protein